MSRIYAFANQKGGVGKTTTAVNLGAYLAARGQRVLVVDSDPQANATSSLGVDKLSVGASVYDLLVNGVPLRDVVLHSPRLKLSVAPAGPALAGAEVELVGLLGREYRLQRALAGAGERYDYVLIDCPPSLGLLTVNALTAASGGVIVPVQAEYLALEGLGQLLNTLELVRAHLNPSLAIRGLVITMYDGRARLSQQVADEVRTHFPGQVFATVVPRSVRLGEAPSYGEPISLYAPHSPGALAYRALADELLAGDGLGAEIGAEIGAGIGAKREAEIGAGMGEHAGTDAAERTARAAEGASERRSDGRSDGVAASIAAGRSQAHQAVEP